MSITREDLDTLEGLVKQMEKTVVDQVKEIKDQVRTQKESLDEFKKRAEDIDKTIMTLRRELPDESKLTARQQEGAARKGGLFDGEPFLDYPELITLSPKHPFLRGTDKEMLHDLCDTNDAVALQLAFRTAKYNGNIQMAMEMTSRTKDWKRWNRVRKFAGFPEMEVGKDTLMYPESGGAGAPLSTTILSAQMLEPVRLDLRVANQFETIPLMMNRQDFPANRGDGMGVRGGAGTTDPPPRADITTPWPSAAHFTSIQFGTVKFDVVDVLAYMWFSDHMITDTVIPWLPYVTRQIAYCISRARDSACLEGDIQGRTQGAHMDDHANTYTVQDRRTLWNGLRRIAANYYVNGGAQTFQLDEFRAQRAGLGRYGLTPSNVVCWLGIGSVYDIMADPAVTKVNEFGPDATIRTGQLADVEGCALIPTEWMRKDLDANGFGAAAGTFTSSVMADTSRFLLGTYGGVAIELTRIAPMLANIIQASVREDFVPLEAIDANKVFAAGLSEVPCNVSRNLLP